MNLTLTERTDARQTRSALMTSRQKSASLEAGRPRAKTAEELIKEQGTLPFDPEKWFAQSPVHFEEGFEEEMKALRRDGS
jgi:hypothetical protein